MTRPTVPADIDLVVERALEEDVGSGDVTADLVPGDARADAEVVSRESAVLCGRPWFDGVFRHLDASIRIEWTAADGDRVEAGQRICRLSGPARPMLTGERTALNFLQLLSGTATAARRLAEAVAGTGCRVLDTRKTLPGLRSAQKYAAACGGVTNHRRGLFDAILVKENHIIAAGGIAAAVGAARQRHPGLSVEVEVESLEELGQALAAKADIVMLDNFDLEALADAVALNRQAGENRARLEASGNVELARLRSIAETGVDFVSVGGVTKNVRAVDLSMRFRLDGPSPA
jgi:nicotinate-nucleotide pyrophosphorylase (carboxylating)